MGASITKKGRESDIGRSRPRIALVTGGASGIGKAIALTLAKRGDKVVVVDLIEDKGKEIAEQVGGFFVKADLALPSDCRRAISRCRPADRTNRRFATLAHPISSIIPTAAISVSSSGRRLPVSESFNASSWKEKPPPGL